MSGVEVLGIMASVIQITQCAISITSTIARIYGTVEAAPERVQQGPEQLRQLLVTADMIKENRVIQTKNVAAHLAAIITYANTLHGMLSRLATSSKKSIKKNLRVCLGNLEERKMIEQFEKIEKEKTALILSIVEVHSSLSNATLDTVRRLTVSSTLYNPDRTLTLIVVQELLQQTVHENRIAVTVTPSKRRLAESRGGYATGGLLKTLVGTSESSDSPAPEFEQPRHMPQFGHYYTNVQAQDRARQLNGDIGHPDNRLPAKINHYESLVAAGCSLQLNGNMSSAAFIGSTFGK